MDLEKRIFFPGFDAFGQQPSRTGNNTSYTILFYTFVEKLSFSRFLKINLGGRVLVLPLRSDMNCHSLGEGDIEEEENHQTADQADLFNCMAQQFFLRLYYLN